MHGSQMIYATVLIMIAQTCDPALTALFTPLHPQAGRYEVCTTSDPIETVAEAGWTIEMLDPLEAFGSAGPYDRFALSRLYGGRRVQVAHGWHESLDSARDRPLDAAPDVFESITLISPYPDASLTKLIAGTMTIRLVISRQ
jgi:hypothetical protein